MSKIDKIIDILKENSLRVTKSRLAIAHVLLKSKYLTSEEIFKTILKDKDVNCDLVSVYRTLSSFEDLGIVSKSEFHNDAARYSLNDLDNKKSKHEHFFKCIKCLTIEAFSDCFISKKEKELEKSGYRKLSHHLEINGLCPNCA